MPDIWTLRLLNALDKQTEIKFSPRRYFSGAMARRPRVGPER